MIQTKKLMISLLMVSYVPAMAQFDPYQPTRNVDIPEIEGYEYSWGDEFDTDGAVDTRLWEFEIGMKRGNEAQCYTDRMENAFVKDGRLMIVSKKEQWLNPFYDPSSGDWRKNTKYAQYTSASIRGKNVRHFLFGRVEVRARLTVGEGYFPAIWTCGYNKNWPANGEIDIMEHYWSGGRQVLTANFAVSKNDPKDIYAANWKSVFTPLTDYTSADPDWLKKYHVWRMDWDEEYITLYIDGVKRNSIKIKEFRNGDGSIAFYNPQYMWLNLAVKDFGRGIDDSLKYEVDYFRVYQRYVDHEPPSSVSALEVVEVGDTWARLAWAPATDNVGVYRYDVYANGMGDTSFKGSTVDTTFVVTGLKPNTTHQFYVRTLDGVGNYSAYDMSKTPLQNGGVSITTQSAWGALTVPVHIYSHILLPTTLADGRKVTWESSDEAVLRSTGIVVLPDVAQQVTLTATTEGLDSKNFDVTVHPRNVSKCLMLRYTFDEDDAVRGAMGDIVVRDVSGAHLDATLIGKAVVDGTLNLTANTASGSSSNGYMVLPQHLLSQMRSFTVTATVNPRTLSKLPRLFDFGSASGNSIFGRLGNLAFGEKYKGATTQWVKSSTQLVTNRDTKMAFTFDAATRQAKVYVNGSEVASGTFAQEPWELAAYAADVRNYVGRTQWWDTSSAGDNLDYCGTIDDFCLFSTELTIGEVQNADSYTSIRDVIYNDGHACSSMVSHIYTLTGQIVRQGTTSLEGLPEGIYIVNGKKVLKK